MEPNRPYPEGIAFDEAWRQRKRADNAERTLKLLHAEIDSAWNRESVTREHAHRWGEIIRAALAVEH